MLTRQEIEIMVASILGAFLFALDGTIMNIALPNIMAVFNQTPDRAQLIVSAYTLASAIAMAASAFLIDRFGIKRIYMISLGIFLVGSILCGLAWNGDVLVLFRIIQGISGGLLLPCAMAMLVIFIPAEKRALAMSAMAVPTMIAPALGPVVGGYLVSYYSWRWCFYVNIPIVIIAVIVAIFWLRETALSARSFDFKGFILVSIGLSCILYALSYAPTWHWDQRVIILLAVGIIAMTLWVIFELRTDSPLLELRLFKLGGFTLSVVLFGTVIAAMFVPIFLLPMFLQNLRQMNALNAGLMLFSNAFGTMIAMPVVGILYEKYGARWPVIIGLLIMALTGLWLQDLDTATPDAAFQWVMFWRGVGCGFALIPTMCYALSVAPPHLSTQGSSMINVVQSVSIAIAIALFATMLDNFQKTDLAIIAQTATPDSPFIVGIIARIQAMLMQAGQTMEAARQTAVVLLYQYFTLHATITAFQKNFVVDAVLSLVGIIPALFLPHGAVKNGGGGVMMV
jgi:EmrB/QacA subfamily drug resistance transporter